MAAAAVWGDFLGGNAAHPGLYWERVGGMDWNQKTRCKTSLVPSRVEGEGREKRRRGGSGAGEKEERGHSFIYYDASCSVGLMCGEQTVFYVLILQAVCVWAGDNYVEKCG